MSKEVYIISAVRTPMGSFGGALSTVPATKLGATAIKGALDKSGVKAHQVNEVFMGNVLQADLGQAPARQAAMFAGIENDVPCTTVNKVCASGMKALSLAAQSILCGDNDVVVAGGMENMSMVPHYYNARNATKLGDVKMYDGMVKDGLTDVYNNVHMGVCADKCATENNITREDQDNFAIESYKRASAAWDAGKFDDEIIPVEVPQRRGDAIVVSKDEEYTNVKMEKIPALRAVFTKDGTVTAANASTLNDGASALVLMSKEKAEELGLSPVAKLIGYGDAAHEPEWFTTAPSKAVPVALKKANLTVADIDYWELNQAFSVVGLVNIQKLGLDAAKVDVNGGAVALGHPLGNSGSRIIVTLINVLKQNGGKYGAAGICNGGGGASAMVIENV
ncbi:MAG: acetyl-CoA C-acyltransferase [Crocinitomicaceae bacterium]|nr:acetyl-CoA C-acyltransferase [Crocinitomicaceae bacterium]